MVDLAGLSEANYKDVVMSFSSVGKEVGMNISKNKADILRISGTMRDAEENAGSMEEKLKQAVKYFEQNGKKLESILFIFPFNPAFCTKRSSSYVT